MSSSLCTASGAQDPTEVSPSSDVRLPKDDRPPFKSGLSQAPDLGVVVEPIESQSL